MNLSDLRAFLTVVEYGSFQRAATARRVSRSTLGRQVERLETELGATLLFRTAGGTTLTAAGRSAVDGATRLLREAAELTEEVRKASGHARGRLRLVVPAGMPVAIRTRALFMLRSAHLELDVDLTEAEDPLGRIEAEFDLLFHFGKAPEREGWFSHVVTRVPVRLRADPTYLAAHGSPETISDLDAHALVRWRWPGCDEGVLPLRDGGCVAASPWLVSANLSLLQEVAAGGGVIVFGPIIPGDETTSLAPVLDEVVAGTVTLRALSRHPSRVDPKIGALLENVRRLLASAMP